MQYPAPDIGKDEEGSVILMAIIIMALLTVIGITSTNTTNIEYQIVRNERVYKDSFYLAEAALSEAAAVMDSYIYSDPTERAILDFETDVSWLHDRGTGGEAELDLPPSERPTGSIDYWANDTDKRYQSEMQQYHEDGNPTNAYYAVVHFGENRQGQSLQLGALTRPPHDYAIYALYYSEDAADKGLILLERGYVKLF